MNTLDKTVLLLDQMVQPHRPNMVAEKKLLYANPETGTMVYHVLTNNRTLPYVTNRYYCWGSFLVGNADGFIDEGFYLQSESSITIGEVTEDADTVTINRKGWVMCHFDMRDSVGPIVIKKEHFQKYPDEVIKLLPSSSPATLPTPPKGKGVIRKIIEWWFYGQPA